MFSICNICHRWQILKMYHTIFIPWLIVSVKQVLGSMPETCCYYQSRVPVKTVLKDLPPKGLVYIPVLASGLSNTLSPHLVNFIAFITYSV